jgi:hypothetical protein
MFCIIKNTKVTGKVWIQTQSECVDLPSHYEIFFTGTRKQCDRIVEIILSSLGACPVSHSISE